ncbi:uncharacterized protein LOC144913644 [Branchiostoma floridae x Branchiostoma belcheri]
MASSEGKKKKKYSLVERYDVGKRCYEFKRQYEEEAASLAKKWDPKRKEWIQPKPKVGYIARTVREAFPSLERAQNSSSEFQSAFQFVRRALAEYERQLEDPTAVDEVPRKKQYRKSGGGRKQTVPEVRLAAFQWFVDVRGSLKARLPKKVFVLKCQQLYEEYLQQNNLHPAEDERVKFSDKWIQGWLEEFRVSLKHPNKRFAVPENVRRDRIVQFLKNIIRVRVFFEKTLKVKDVDIINGDQMPLHRNETAGQRTLTMKDCPTYVKENYMLSRERVTVFTQASSKNGLAMRPHFVFKGKGTVLQGKLQRPEGVETHWGPKGSYRLDTMLATINTLPNLRARNIFSMKQWAIYILDDYSVHVTEEVRQALLARGYILVCMGGGITGDLQVNDTHLHHFLKAAYRQRESELMIQQLRENPTKIPSPSRDDMMKMLVDSWDSLDVDVDKALKQNFILNALDGSEDLYVRDKLFELVGEEVTAFRKEELEKEPPKTLKGLLATITPPEGVRRAAPEDDNQNPVDEGSELLDTEDGEIEFNLEVEEEVEGEDEDGAPEVPAATPVQVTMQSSTTTSQSVASTGHVGLPTDTTDETFNKDAKFLNELGTVLNMYGKETSTLMLPHLCHMRSAYAKARNSVKNRLRSNSSLVQSLTASPTEVPVSASTSGSRVPVSASTSGSRVPVSASTSGSRVPVSASTSGSRVPVSASTSGSRVPVSASTSGSHVPVSASTSGSHVPVSASTSGSRVPVSASTSGSHVPVSASTSESRASVASLTTDSTPDSPPTTPVSLNVDDHVLVRFGTLEMPAVVVRGEGAGLAVRYFEGISGPTPGLYAAQDHEYEVLRDDVIRNIAAPTIKLRGTRVYYQFVGI